MKPETTQILRDILSTAETAHAEVSQRLRTELRAVEAGHPTPTHAKGGRSTLQLIVDEKKRIALRGVLATVALEGRGAGKFELNIADCFNSKSQAVSNAHGLRLADIFPGLGGHAAFEIERDLEAKGVHFKARRIVALLKPKG